MRSEKTEEPLTTVKLKRHLDPSLLTTGLSSTKSTPSTTLGITKFLDILETNLETPSGHSSTTFKTLKTNLKKSTSKTSQPTLWRWLTSSRLSKRSTLSGQERYKSLIAQISYLKDSAISILLTGLNSKKSWSSGQLWDRSTTENQVSFKRRWVLSKRKY